MSLWKKHMLVYFDIQKPGKKKIHFLHCPFEGRADMHHKIRPDLLNWQCYLNGGSKG